MSSRTEPFKNSFGDGVEETSQVKILSMLKGGSSDPSGQQLEMTRSLSTSDTSERLTPDKEYFVMTQDEDHPTRLETRRCGLAPRTPGTEAMVTRGVEISRGPQADTFFWFF